MDAMTHRDIHTVKLTEEELLLLINLLTGNLTKAQARLREKLENEYERRD